MTDYDRWRRVIVQNANVLVFQRMDDTFVFYPAKTDAGGEDDHADETCGSDMEGPACVRAPRAGSMSLDGDMDGQRIRMSMRLFRITKLLLLWSRGFNWVQEYPFNR